MGFFQDRENRCKKRYDEIRTSGVKIHALVEENLQYFKVSRRHNTAAAKTASLQTG